MTQPPITSFCKERWKPRFAKIPRLICWNGNHFSLSARWRRQNTAYVNDRSNWVCLCNSCNKENEDHWRDMWAEYRAECL